MRRLTDKELQEKRAKGLCFRCDEKWSMRHQCKRRELSVLIAQEEPEGEESTEEEDLSYIESLHPSVSLSLNSVVGIDNPKTMKLLGRINGHPVVVMVDPGATHNFISLMAVERLKIPVTGTKEFEVTLGDGKAIVGEGECRQVTVSLDEFEVCEDFFPLNLGNFDVIFGIQWLEKLGPMTTNWKLQEMRFEAEGKRVTLKGDPSLGRSQMSLKAMYRAVRKGGEGILIELNEMECVKEGGNGVRVPTYLELVISKYDRIFHMPEGLSPSRNREHRIILKDGTNPISVMPYRYPQAQI